MTKTETAQDIAPTDEQLFRAAILAQLRQAERELPGGATEMIEQLPAELQAVVIGVWDWADARGVEVG